MVDVVDVVDVADAASAALSKQQTSDGNDFRRRPTAGGPATARNESNVDVERHPPPFARFFLGFR